MSGYVDGFGPCGSVQANICRPSLGNLVPLKAVFEGFAYDVGLGERSGPICSFSTNSSNSLLVEFIISLRALYFALSSHPARSLFSKKKNFH